MITTTESGQFYDGVFAKDPETNYTIKEEQADPEVKTPNERKNLKLYEAEVHYLNKDYVDYVNFTNWRAEDNVFIFIRQYPDKRSTLTFIPNKNIQKIVVE